VIKKRMRDKKLKGRNRQKTENTCQRKINKGRKRGKERKNMLRKK
jgi:hypothetical protein